MPVSIVRLRLRALAAAFSEGVLLHRGILLILFAAFILNLLVGLHIARNFPDIARAHDDSYFRIAKYLYEDGVFSLGERDHEGRLLPTSWRTPLYPLMYWALFHGTGSGVLADASMRVVFIFLNLLTLWMIYKIGCLFTERAGCIAAALAALDLNTIFFCHELDNPNILLTFLSTLFLYHLIKFLKGGNFRKSLLLSSLFLGLAALTQPVIYLLWIPMSFLILIYLLTRGTGARSLLSMLSLFLIPQAVIIGGWKARNLYQTGYGNFVSMEGQHMLFWNANHLRAYQEGIDSSEAKRLLMAQYITPASERLDRGALNLYYDKIGKGIILRAPLDYAVVLTKWVLLILLVFLGYFALVANPLSIARYRLPIMPLVFFMAGHSLLFFQKIYPSWRRL